MARIIVKHEDTGADILYPPPPQSGNWITDHAWISGLAGLLMVVVTAVYYHMTDALEAGVSLAGLTLTRTRVDSILLALVTIAFVMLAVEWVRLWLHDRKNFFCVDPQLKNGHYGLFLKDALVIWLANLCLLGVAILFFKTASEYGYAIQHEFYQAWFRFLELAWSVYLWGGLPYVLITRAVKYDALADRRDFASLAIRVFLWAISHLPPLKRHRPEFNAIDKKAARGLIVKLFFTPLMTVFFAGQFPAFVDGVGMISTVIPDLIVQGNYSHGQLNRDIFTVGIVFVATFDVAMAWCGYTTSSRWFDNQTVSAEPTILGWLVCLACYPPFQELMGVYYDAPPEHAILNFSQQWIVTLFAVMMLLSYLVYMLATLWFGVRFSNLTNRGIIRKGPYAFIRHPAYAAKNFAWWCVMFPVVVYNAIYNNPAMAAIQVFGLIFMTWLYYLRAITEERHLSQDPYYRVYCENVKYRFIPGLL